MSEASTTIIEYLIADHARLHALLSEATAEGRFDAPAFARFREGLLRHIAIEEKLLLVAVRAANGAPPARWRELRIEHAALTSLLVPAPDLDLCREIEALLGEHDAKEEGTEGVYAECECVLGRESAVALGRSAMEFPRVPVSPHGDAGTGHRTRASALAAASRIPFS